MHHVLSLSYTPEVRRNSIVLHSLSILRDRFSARSFAVAAALVYFCAATVPARTQSSSSADSPAGTQQESTSAPSIAIPQSTGSPVTLETSEPLFDLAAALNSCGYDADLANSNPVREEIRTQLATLVAASPKATSARRALCAYIQSHTLNDPARNLAQYVSLSLYLSPDLTPTVDETQLPPDSTQVVNVLPLLRTFVEETHLHALWIEHRAPYSAITDRMHDPLTRMILDTNIYLKSPVSSYEGRRFVVLAEPLLAPTAVNARIYGSNYIIVVSPTVSGQFHLEQIRHTFLHYEVEPMVYARASAMDRLLPLLKTVQDAPIEFSYKSDIVALIAECLIKAIEARTMETGLQKPSKPTSIRLRSDYEQYDNARSLYDRQTEAVRRNAADLATRHGWVLTSYFYDQLILEEHNGVSLQDNVGQMVYGMDVDRQRHIAQQVVFLPDNSREDLRRVAAPPSGLRLAELKLMQGDSPTAQALAEKVLADPHGDHSEANYILARINLLQRRPDAARTLFTAALADAHDPRTAAWSHIYLGRLYDVQADRKQAVREYRAALDALGDTPAGVQADTRAAAAAGMKAPFIVPAAEAHAADTEAGKAAEGEDDTALDPSGKAEKEAYRPSAKP